MLSSARFREDQEDRLARYGNVSAAHLGEGAAGPQRGQAPGRAPGHAVLTVR